MNYVAHALLAPAEPIALLGNLLGDSVKGPLPGALASNLAAAVAHHRRVDAACDAHPAFRRSRRLLFPALGHYAGVVVDVLFDHVLSADWSVYVPAETLDDFAARVYTTITAHRESLPAPLRESADTLVRHDVLRRYRELDSVREALRRMHHRLRRPVDLTAGIGAFREHRAEFAADFGALFADLRALEPA